MTRRLTCALLMTFSFTAKAQTLNDPVYLNYSFLPKANFKSGNRHITSRFLELNVSTPALTIGKRLKVFNAFYYRKSSLELGNSLPQHHPLPNAVHDARYSAIIRLQLSSRWELIALPRVMLRSGLRSEVNKKDFFPQVAVLASYAVNGDPNFKIGFGGALNNDFERNAFVPLGSLYYDSEKIKVEVVYPNAQFLYKLSDDLEVGLFATVDGAISNVASNALADAGYLRTFQVIVAPTVSRRLYKNIFGHLKAGLVPVRRFETLDADFKAIETTGSELDPGLFFRVGLSFRLKNSNPKK